MRSLQQTAAINNSVAAAQFVENMQGQVDDPSRLIGSAMDEDEVAQNTSYSNPNDVRILQDHHAIRSLLLYVLHEHEKLEEHRIKLSKLKQTKSTYFHRGLTQALYALNCCALSRKYADNMQRRQQRSAEKLANKYYSAMSFYLKEGQISPDIAILADLVQAELWTLSDDGRGSRESDIMQWFNVAIDGCTRNKLWVFRAIAYERAAEYLLLIKRNQLAVDYLTHAWNAYGDYGATVKMEMLSDHFGEMVKFPDSVEQHVCSQVVSETKVAPLSFRSTT